MKKTPKQRVDPRFGPEGLPDVWESIRVGGDLGKNRKTNPEWIWVVDIPEIHLFPTAKPPKRQGKTSKTESHRERAPDSVQKVPRASGSRLEWARASGKIAKKIWSGFW